MDPVHPEVAAAVNAAFALERDARFDDAIATLRAALAQHPGEAELAWRLGLLLLREGAFAEGWRLFEQRPVQMGGRPPGKPALAFPEWDGRPVGSLLILPEQGLGDQIMFARYAPFLRGRGVEPTLLCHPVLARCFAARLGVRVLSGQGRVELPRCDAWALGPSLPHRTRTAPQQPYLRAAQAGSGIGFLGRGNPAFVNDALRSLPEALCAEILSWPGVVSLAREDTGADDLEDTAAAIERLDLVISVDTAIAHLAGAMGKTTWLLLPHVADWRWLRDRAHSPWYPTMRLFRQPSPGDWAAVVGDVRRALDARGG